MNKELKKEIEDKYGVSKMNEKRNEIKTKDWISPQEASILYGFSISTLAKWRMENKYLSFSKIGKYIKYKREDIEAFLNKNIVEAKKENNE